MSLVQDRQSTMEIGTPKNGTTHGRPRRQTADRIGIDIRTRFCPENVESPFDTVEWDSRTAAIKDEHGGVL
ncbi:MAG TPA: hypothetical protein VIY86_15295, partial [Pirellulaceae bacterium]